MARVFGVKYGVATLLIDLLKALICVLIAKVIMTSIGGAEAGRLAGYLSGCAVIVGHNYPLLLGLKGGKGICLRNRCVYGAPAAVYIDSTSLRASYAADR